MRTRRTPLNADHVGALNLVEIDFADHAAVLAAHRKLFESFSKPLPRLEMEVERRKDDQSKRVNERILPTDRGYLKIVSAA